MNSAHRKILAAIFTDPASSSIRWSAIEALFVNLGATMIEGSGSRVSFIRDQTIASFHRPHPGKEAKRYQVRDAREFLVKLGVKP